MELDSDSLGYKALYSLHTYIHTIEIKLSEAKNKLTEMRETVNEELKHIPRGSWPQNMLRMFYQPLRMRSLGKKAKTNKTKEDVLLESINAVKREYPGFAPEYENKFFKLL